MQARLNETPSASAHEVIETNTDLKQRCLKPGNENEAARQAIASAEQAMEKLSVNFDDWMASESIQLAKARDTAKSSGFAKKELLELFQAAHNMKGQATTLGYPFADEICSSLEKVCKNLDPITFRLKGLGVFDLKKILG